MNSPPNPPNDRDNSGAAPYRDLFIYYLKGRLKTDGLVLPDDCIGNWEEEEDSFLFFSRPALDQVETILRRQPHLSFIDSYQMPYEQWLGEKFSTFEHGKFRVIPPWEASPSSSDNRKVLSIILDPGLVFGTGTHPTTRDCLDALQLAADSSAINTVLDLGTGTGLLALAAARLGCGGVIAADLNMLAARTAHRNVNLNHLQDRVMTVQGRAEDISPAILAADEVRKISLTGSTRVGQMLMSEAARTVKRSSMELGGHAPVVVCDDANVDAAADLCVQFKFRNAGQVCISPSRFYVHETLADTFVSIWLP